MAKNGEEDYCEVAEKN